jgi:hypothetical protein
MSHKQKIAAFVSGILLFIVRAYVSPILDTSAPAGHYEFLGDGLFAYIVLDGFEPALLSLVLSLAWSWITLRWLARPPRVAVWWVLGGLIVGLMCWQLNDDVSWHYSCLDLIRQHPNAHWFPSPPDCSVLTNYLNTLLYDLIQPDPRLLAMLAAILAGLAAAAWMVLRSERPARASYA